MSILLLKHWYRTLISQKKPKACAVAHCCCYVCMTNLLQTSETSTVKTQNVHIPACMQRKPDPTCVITNLCTVESCALNLIAKLFNSTENVINITLPGFFISTNRDRRRCLPYILLTEHGFGRKKYNNENPARDENKDFINQNTAK